MSSGPSTTDTRLPGLTRPPWSDQHLRYWGQFRSVFGPVRATRCVLQPIDSVHHSVHQSWVDPLNPRPICHLGLDSSRRDTRVSSGRLVNMSSPLSPRGRTSSVVDVISYRPGSLARRRCTHERLTKRLKSGATSVSVSPSTSHRSWPRRQRSHWSQRSAEKRWLGGHVHITTGL